MKLGVKEKAPTGDGKIPAPLPGHQRNIPAHTPEAAVATSTATAAARSATADYPFFNAKIGGNSGTTAAVALGARTNLPLPPQGPGVRTIPENKAP
jgi:hypothetical protein